MCKYLFSIEISFYIKFFAFFLYLSFLCVSIYLVWKFLFILNLLLSFYIYPNFTGDLSLVSSTENAVYWNFLLSFYIYHFYV